MHLTASCRPGNRHSDMLLCLRHSVLHTQGPNSPLAAVHLRLAPPLAASSWVLMDTGSLRNDSDVKGINAICRWAGERTGAGVAYAFVWTEHA